MLHVKRRVGSGDVARPLNASASGALAYIAAISCVIILAASASAVERDPLPVAGAVIFAVSDMTVARDRFISPVWLNRAVGLPLYYAAQLMLAMTVRS